MDAHRALNRRRGQIVCTPDEPVLVSTSISAANCTRGTWFVCAPNIRTHVACGGVVQVLVLPPLQRCGYGRALVAAAYNVAQQRDAIDLTVSRCMLWLNLGAQQHCDPLLSLFGGDV